MMAIQVSTGFRNGALGFCSKKRLLEGGVLGIYSGTQATDADTAPNGTLLYLITNASGAHTAETIGSGSVSLTGGGSGSVDTLTVNSVAIIGAAVPFNGTLTQTATDLAAAINAYESSPKYRASASSAVVTIYPNYGVGAGANTYVVAVTTTTITTSTANISGGVTAVNGLKFLTPAAGVLSLSGTWSGVALADGTPQSFRFARSQAELAGASTAYPRVDGSVSTSNADLNINPCTAVTSVPLTISSFTFTEPAA